MTNRDDEHHYDRDEAGDSPDNPESEDNTQVADAGIPGQIMYPDREVDAERAAAFAAGKVDTLYPEDETDEDLYDDEGNPLPGDETGEETEPAAMRGTGVAAEEEEAAQEENHDRT